MKITMYELLGMVKNGKAPKKIRIRSASGVYDKKFYFDGDIYMYKDEYGEHAMTDDISIEMSLNDEVEILEEKKIPEKIDIYEDEEGHYFIDKHCKKIYITCDEVNFMVEEFNQLIDYLKSKGE